MWLYVSIGQGNVFIYTLYIIKDKLPPRDIGAYPRPLTQATRKAAAKLQKKTLSHVRQGGEKADLRGKKCVVIM